MGSTSGIQGPIDAATRLGDDLAGREGYASDGAILGFSRSEEGWVDVVQYEMDAIVGVATVRGGVFGAIVHFENVSGRAVHSLHGRYGRSTSE